MTEVHPWKSNQEAPQASSKSASDLFRQYTIETKHHTESICLRCYRGIRDGKDRDGYSARKVDLEVIKKSGVDLDESLVSAFSSDRLPMICSNCLINFIKHPFRRLFMD